MTTRLIVPTTTNLGLPTAVPGVTYDYDAWIPGFTVSWDNPLFTEGGGGSEVTSDFALIQIGTSFPAPGPYPTPRPDLLWPPRVWAGTGTVTTSGLVNLQAQCDYSVAYYNDTSEGPPGHKATQDYGIATFTRSVSQFGSTLIRMMSAMSYGTGATDLTLQTMRTIIESGGFLGTNIIEFAADQEFSTSFHMVFTDDETSNGPTVIKNITGSGWYSLTSPYSHSDTGDVPAVYDAAGWMTPLDLSGFPSTSYDIDLSSVELGEHGELALAFVTEAHQGNFIVGSSLDAAVNMALPLSITVPSYRIGHVHEGIPLPTLAAAPGPTSLHFESPRHV